MTISALVLVLILSPIAALHAYWGVGGRWPARDEDSLRRLVVGTHKGPMPGLFASLAVALALFAAAGVVLARHSVLAAGPIGWIVTAGYGVLIVVFAGRGLAPYLTPAFQYARGTPFFAMNLKLYAPICLAIAALLTVDFPR